LVSADGFPETEDPFLFFHKIVKKDALDAATFDAMSQADFLSMMTENLELLEKCLYQIKAMLKEPEFKIFEDVKTQTLERVRIEQEKMNPKRPNTAALNAQIKNKN